MSDRKAQPKTGSIAYIGKDAVLIISYSDDNLDAEIVRLPVERVAASTLQDEPAENEG